MSCILHKYINNNIIDTSTDIVNLENPVFVI